MGLHFSKKSSSILNSLKAISQLISYMNIIQMVSTASNSQVMKQIVSYQLLPLSFTKKNSPNLPTSLPNDISLDARHQLLLFPLLPMANTLSQLALKMEDMESQSTVPKKYFIHQYSSMKLLSISDQILFNQSISIQNQ